MSSQPPSQPPRRTSVAEQRAKRQPGKPNRSQVRAAQARAAQQAAPPVEQPASTAVTQELSPETGERRTVVRSPRLTPAQRRAIERGNAARGTGLPTGVVRLTRHEEMLMVKDDMNRLLVIAGILLVGMIALLLIID